MGFDKGRGESWTLASVPCEACGHVTHVPLNDLLGGSAPDTQPPASVPDTEALLAEAEQIDDEASCGPWYYVEREGEGCASVYLPDGNGEITFRDEGDALFVATARDLVPRLASALRASEAARAAFDQWRVEWDALHKAANESLAAERDALAAQVRRDHARCDCGDIAHCLLCHHSSKGYRVVDDVQTAWPCTVLRTLGLADAGEGTA